MSQVQAVSGRPKYVPYWEGIRGFGFLMVFLVHYIPPYQITPQGSIAFRIVTGLESIAFLAVPIFFVLSGFLIGGILYSTRDREGYFKVFYCRRVIRVFPLYYLALLIIGCVDASLKFSIDYRFWTHFLFIKNLFPRYATYNSPAVLRHYWTLATEEQFYLLWPLVVWLFPRRRQLFVIASLLVVFIFGLRFASPYLFSFSYQIGYFSLTRADAILMGVLLALIRNEAGFEWMKRLAKWIALAGGAGLVVWALRNGEYWPKTFQGVQIIIPWLNFTAASIVIAVMEEKSWLNEVCSQRWICWLGKRSYSLYIFHYTYYHFFAMNVVAQLAHYMSQRRSVVVASALAFSLTLVLAMLSYRFIEIPAQRLKQHLKYGPVKENSSSPKLREEILVGTGA